MKNTKVAEIENMGVKGTYIKILDTTIIENN
jgi:GTP-sensing pleiotropic transcriptional regulator CodY